MVDYGFLSEEEKAYLANAVVDNIPETIDELNPELSEEALMIKQKAAEVLSEAIKIMKKYQNLERVNSLSKTLDSSLPVSIKNFQAKMVQRSGDYRNLMQKVMNLQKAVNEFMGHTIKIAFVAIDKKGKPTVYILDDKLEHWGISKSAESRGGTIGGKIKAGAVMAAANDVEQKRNSLPKLDATFEEVYSRAQISLQRIKMQGAFYILWKPDARWRRYKISNKGTLAESYFAFYINEINDEFSNFIETAVGQFVTDERYGLIKVDNASGFFKGDVSKNGVEYAVKTKGASSMGFTEVVRDYALDIYNSTNLEEYFKNMREEADNVKGNQAFEVTKKTIGEKDEELRAAYRKAGKGNPNTQFNINLNIF